MADKYDEAIAYLTANPDEIQAAWDGGYYRGEETSVQAACLFNYANSADDLNCGCLTQIRSDPTRHAHTFDLTREIRLDSRIPVCATDITVADLPVFAEWQRRLDKEIGE